MKFEFFSQVFPSYMSSLSSVKISAPHIAPVRLAIVWKIAYTVESHLSGTSI